MKILLDHCVDRRLKQLLPAHEVRTAREMGWDSLKNGQLLDQAQTQFEVLLTVDRNIQHQQNLEERTIAIVVLAAPNNRLPTLTPLIPEVEAILPTVQPGRVYLVATPRTPTLNPEQLKQVPEQTPKQAMEPGQEQDRGPKLNP